MASYLSQFNYQFIRGNNKPTSDFDRDDTSLRRWVFLHGLMGFGLNWRRIAQSLEETDLALVFDQRGHGKSLKPQSQYSAQDYADDLELIRQELQWDSFILVGHSMGGRNAINYASRYPQYLQKLIIEDIGPEAKPEAIAYYRDLLNAIPTPFINKRLAKEWLLNEFLHTPWGRQGGSTLAQYLYANIIETESGQADWRFAKWAMIESIQQGRAQDHWEQWDSISIPTLIIRGAQSRDLSPEIYHQMLHRNSLAKGIELAEAGHWAHFEQPTAFIGALLSFVNFDNPHL